MRIQLTIAYEGTNYCGWQVQANGLSIQAVVQKTLETVLKHPIDLTGSSRTDSGVHALGQTAHFDTSLALDLRKLCLRLNMLLPPDIRVLRAEEVASDFHARHSAQGKIYAYHLQLSKTGDPNLRRYRTLIFRPIDREAIRRSFPFLLGTHDFTAFANEKDHGIASYDAVRTLKRIELLEEEDGIRLELEGNGFLYKMVRNIVGTLLEIATNKRSPENLRSVLLEKNRKKAGPTAPAQGLFLVRALYKKDRLENVDVAHDLLKPSLREDNL